MRFGTRSMAGGIVMVFASPPTGTETGVHERCRRVRECERQYQDALR